jgi:2,4-dienoyl-CoA reductase-like NADH-dependent reductase (Old Yellow Enzyme family)
MASALFTPLSLRDLEIRNRLWVSPMCQYSCGTDGLATDWHLVHLGSRAVGGAGLVMAEATAVTPEGRISPHDLGLWSSDHVEALKPVTRFISAQGAVPAVQLAHAGRKASTKRPWDGTGPAAPSEGGWQPIGPSPIAYTEGYTEPRELTTDEVRGVVDDFAAAAARAVEAGFRAIELHEAHGYLVAQFLSPFSNRREDEYGGDFDGRTRLAVEAAAAVRAAIPAGTPLLVRLSASEYVEGGWDLPQTIELAKRLKAVGVDLIDASSGGNLPHQRVRAHPGYQVPFARAIREQADIATAAVGLITSATHADAIVATDDADAVFIGREALRDPYFPLHAAAQLHADVEWPVQYQRARP